MLGTLVTVANPKTAVSVGKLASDYGIPLIVDSGAWSNFNGKANVTVESHTVWLRKHYQPGVRHVGLDVIGNMEATYKNWVAEVDSGLLVEPTLHYGADPKFVDKYLRKGLVTDWINLGGMAHLQKHRAMLPKLAGWCGAVMRRLPPEVKVHGLGATTPALCNVVPFDAVDSTYWLEVHKFNTIPLFVEGTKNWIRVMRSLRAKDWDSRKKQKLGSLGDVLFREYGISASELARSDMDVCVDLTIRAQKKFAEHFSKRHNKPVTVYLAGSNIKEFEIMRRYNNE
jgi:hypothetical protein